MTKSTIRGDGAQSSSVARNRSYDQFDTKDSKPRFVPKVVRDQDVSVVVYKGGGRPVTESGRQR